VPTTVVAGQPVSHVDHGGPGPVVVLLHSFLMDAEMFDPQVASLGADLRLVTVDERGHGGTPADGPFDYWDCARDVLGLLDALGVERAALVGTSQGGFIALRVALLAPERVSCLALLGTSADAQDPEVAAAYRGLGDAWAAKGPQDALVDSVATICLGERADAGLVEHWKAKWRAVPPAQVKANIGTLVGRESLLDRLAEVTCPVLVLHGTADGAYPVTHAEQVVAGVPHAEPLVVVDGGAHFLSLTDAAEVDPALRAFLLRHA
jgi:pimeloyl-ACP methyl ester carboxylesterase